METVPEFVKLMQPEILEYIKAQDRDSLAIILKDLHPQDISALFDELSEEEQLFLFNCLLEEVAIEVFENLDIKYQKHIIKTISRDRANLILNDMSADDRADLFRELSHDLAEKFFSQMNKKEAEDVKRLLKYPEGTAGALMTTEYVPLYYKMTVEQAIEKIKSTERGVETIYYDYVTNEKNELLGVITLRYLIKSRRDALLSDIMWKKVIKIKVDMPQEEVAAKFMKYDFVVMPVVDDENRLLGIITFDDIMDVIEEEATRDMYRMVGLDEEVETGEVGAIKQAFSRIRWLIATVIGSLTAGTVIKLLGPKDPHLSKKLSTFIPAIMGLGGAVAIQSATMLIRGFATGDIEIEDFASLFLKELKVVFILGIALSSILFLSAFFWEKAWIFSIVVAIAMFVQALWAFSVGTFIPYFLNRVGVDPAIAAGPLTQMICDITGLVVYFTTVSLFLTYLF